MYEVMKMGIRKIEIEKTGIVGRWNGIDYTIRIECNSKELADGLRKSLVQQLDGVSINVEENIVTISGWTDFVNTRFVGLLNVVDSRIDQILSVVKETSNELDKLANYKEKRIIEMGE